MPARCSHCHTTPRSRPRAGKKSRAACYEDMTHTLLSLLSYTRTCIVDALLAARALPTYTQTRASARSLTTGEATLHHYRVLSLSHSLRSCRRRRQGAVIDSNPAAITVSRYHEQPPAGRPVLVDDVSVQEKVALARARSTIGVTTMQERTRTRREQRRKREIESE